MKPRLLTVPWSAARLDDHAIPAWPETDRIRARVVALYTLWCETRRKPDPEALAYACGCTALQVKRALTLAGAHQRLVLSDNAARIAAAKIESGALVRDVAGDLGIAADTLTDAVRRVTGLRPMDIGPPRPGRRPAPSLTRARPATEEEQRQIETTVWQSGMTIREAQERWRGIYHTADIRRAASRGRQRLMARGRAA